MQARHGGVVGWGRRKEEWRVEGWVEEGRREDQGKEGEMKGPFFSSQMNKLR